MERAANHQQAAERELLDGLRETFAKRVRLVKKTEEEAVAEVRAEHQQLTKWVASNAEREGSFLWFCDLFEMDPGAVRRAIAEKK